MNGITYVKSPRAQEENILTYSSLCSFTIEDKIGKGQYGVVYKAISVKDGTKVALKKISVSQMTNEQSMEDCLKEASLLQTLQQLNHPNIIKYIASFVENNELHIVLELADGGDLSELINYAKKEKLLLAEHIIWDHFVQIARALQHMHEKRIMHRDIKPANVFLTRNGVIKLGDLGLGRFMSNATHAVHSLVGTPYYMSPERINGQEYCFKSDVWSLGCLLYELAALQSPFYGDTINFCTLRRKIETSFYPPVPCSRYSQQLHELISSCLRSDLNARPDINFVHNFANKMNDRFREFGHTDSPHGITNTAWDHRIP